MKKSLQTYKNYVAAQRGQVLLIVVLVMVVALTVGLSVATRSITNVRTTTEEDNSQRAFSAAEAGIEKALKTNLSDPNVKPLGNSAKITNVVVSDLKASQIDNTYMLKNGDPVEKNVGYDVWFVNHNGPGGTPNYGAPWSGDVTFYWGAQNNGGGCNMAALEIVFITGLTSTVHQVFDPCTSGTRNNSFTHPGTNSTMDFTTGTGTSIGAVTLYNKVVIHGTSGLLIARVIPLYQNAIVAVQAASLPSQGSLITSTGESGETFRKLQVNNPYPQVPTELYSVLFAPGN